MGQSMYATLPFFRKSEEWSSIITRVGMHCLVLLYPVITCFLSVSHLVFCFLDDQYELEELFAAT